MVRKWKKGLLVTSLVVGGALAGSALTFAANGIQKIEAALNTNIQFKVDSTRWEPKDDTGRRQYPIVYQGNTYLPLKSVAQALGADAVWNGSTQTITISRSGDDQFGIPYRDAGASSSSPSKSSASSVSSYGIITLSGSQEAMTSKLQGEAAKLMRIYGQTLKDGNASAFNDYVDAYVSGPIANSPTSETYTTSKADFKRFFTSIVNNNKATTLSKYADVLEQVQSSDIEVSFVSEKDEYGQDFKFSYYPSDWNGYSGVYVTFKFTPDGYGSDRYVLSCVQFI